MPLLKFVNVAREQKLVAFFSFSSSGTHLSAPCGRIIIVFRHTIPWTIRCGTSGSRRAQQLRCKGAPPNPISAVRLFAILCGAISDQNSSPSHHHHRHHLIFYQLFGFPSSTAHNFISKQFRWAQSAFGYQPNHKYSRHSPPQFLLCDQVLILAESASLGVILWILRPICETWTCIAKVKSSWNTFWSAA